MRVMITKGKANAQRIAYSALWLVWKAQIRMHFDAV